MFFVVYDDLKYILTVILGSNENLTYIKICSNTEAKNLNLAIY